MKNILRDRLLWLRGILLSGSGGRICWKSWGVGWFSAYANLALIWVWFDGGPAPFLLLVLSLVTTKIVYSYRTYEKPEVRPPGPDAS